MNKRGKDKAARSEIHTNNIYAYLSIEEQHMDAINDDENDENENKVSGTTLKVTKCKPPPLVLHGRINHHKMLNILQSRNNNSKPEIIPSKVSKFIPAPLPQVSAWETRKASPEKKKEDSFINSSSPTGKNKSEFISLSREFKTLNSLRDINKFFPV
ncbi:hypothetical protein WA026_012372 [Henosepilachna vigintioctopunctata]|uniref:Uncharacterized protein n=1 Tax=Henosepilachna vigintioctopunctata TaxID=420089 RepID=A0AAW1US20_9CUCU